MPSDRQMEMGRRVRSAREQANLSQSQLGEMIGLDNTQVSKIESGKRGMASHELFGIADATGTDPNWLFVREAPDWMTALAARTSEVGVSLDDPAIQRVIQIGKARRLLDQARDVPPRRAGLPTMSFTGSAWNQGVRAARELREVLGLGDEPVDDLAARLEDRFDVNVLFESLDTDISGLSVAGTGFTLLFVNTDNDPGHQMFTLAHELGHALFRDSAPVCIDSRTVTPSETQEKRADGFAVEFLMPRTDIIRRARTMGSTDDAVLNMVNIYGVSVMALSYRLENLSLIDPRRGSELRALRRSGLSRRCGRYAEFETGQQRVGWFRAPEALRAEALAGFRANTIGILPLADILDRPPRELIEDLMFTGPEAAVEVAEPVEAASR